MLGIDELLPWLVLALGAAMLVGNGLALIRPPERRDPDHTGEDDLQQAPLARTLTMMAIGAVAAIWAIGSMVAG